MHQIRPLLFLKALLASGFAMFALSFSHITLSHASMMPGMSHTDSSSTPCRIVCTSTPKPEDQVKPTGYEQKDDDPEPYVAAGLTTSLALLGVVFIVKRVYLSSSWRPPDKVLLYGHYADGL